MPSQRDDFADAPCRDDPEAWFPNGSMLTRQHQQAVRTCIEECPHTAACYLLALRVPQVSGIWGGVRFVRGRKLRPGQPAPDEQP